MCTDHAEGSRTRYFLRSFFLLRVCWTPHLVNRESATVRLVTMFFLTALSQQVATTSAVLHRVLRHVDATETPNFSHVMFSKKCTRTGVLLSTDHELIPAACERP
jgi:hypothetical protein